MFTGEESPGISRRTLLVGGGAGLLIAWAVWPRGYRPNLRTAPGETMFNAFLKIGSDGRVIVAVPQAEIGQGVYTSFPQIVADELGADWRTVAVEPAPISPLYVNDLIAEEVAADGFPSFLEGIGRWAVREYATRSALMITAGSTSIRAFESRLREAGAAARALLLKAAAEQWNVDWESLDTAGGFAVNGGQRIGFGELAAKAAQYDLPEEISFRGGTENRLTGQPLPRLDLPSKVDGSARFAGDVRLPDMVFASVRQGPLGGATLARIDRKAAERVRGLVAIVENPNWVAAAATNWWAANQAVEAMKPAFRTTGNRPSSKSIEAALTAALTRGDANTVFSLGNVEENFAAGGLIESHYSVHPAPNAPVEPLTATVRFTGDRLEVWAPTQAPAFARAAAARAAGIPEEQVTLYPMLVGGGYGRKLETLAIEQAVTVSGRVRKPVQLSWSRIEETYQDTFRPPALARLGATLAQGGSISAWRARIAVPATVEQVMDRISSGVAGGADREDHAAVAGAVPPYSIPAAQIDHVPAETGLNTGIWRSGAHSYTAFFNECFVDELARAAGVEPLSFRMQMLGNNPRLARCLTTAASLGGWDGGAPGSMMGIAAHSCFGSHVATLAEVERAPGLGLRVVRIVSAADCGQIVNPDIVRQLVEGGIVHGLSGVFGKRIGFEDGLPTAIGFKDLGLPILADTPEIMVEILDSEEAPGGATELGVPTVAPAVANALFAATGQRFRSLPLVRRP